MNRRASSTAVKPTYCECPNCGKAGLPAGTATDGTRLYKCRECTRLGIGIDDSPYEYPVWFDKEGRRYT